MFSDFAGLEFSLPLTQRIATTDAMRPIAERISGKMAAVLSSNAPLTSASETATAARVIAEIMEPT